MIGAIKRRWKSSNKKCSDKDKEKVTPLPSFPPAGNTVGGVGNTTGPCSANNIHRLRKGPPLPPVDFIHDFIHVNSGRIELHPGATDNNKEQQHQQLLWGQHLHYETRHSWCGPQQMGVPDNNKLGTKKTKDVLNGNGNLNLNKSPPLPHHNHNHQIIQRLNDLEKCSKGVPNLEPVVSALKEEVAASVGRQEKLVSDLESLHLRVHTLETNNKALANIILPTLMRLTKEKSPSTQTVATTTTSTGTSGNNNKGSPRKVVVAVATSPIKSASLPSSPQKQQLPLQQIEPSTNENPTKMKQSHILHAIPRTTSSSSATPTLTPTKIPPKPSPVHAKKKPGSLDLKKPSTSPTLTNTNSSPTPASTTSIPFFRPNTTSTTSTTHPPKTATSKSKAQSKPKSRLPVRKSSSSIGPSIIPQSQPINHNNSSSSTPSSKPSKKLSSGSSGLVIENKMRFNTGPPRPVPSTMSAVATVTIASLPPKDEGYSTMSNGALDSNIDCQVLPTPSTATFTRPKKLFGENSSSSASTSSGGGTWTKTKNNKKSAASKSIPSPTMSNATPSTGSSGRTFATATVLQPASITTTLENVRIVRGIPTEIRFSSQSSQDDYSGGMVLLEDSDDSDILFLPIEVSSTSGSDSTLVPYPYSRSSACSTSSAAASAALIGQIPTRSSNNSRSSSSKSNKLSGYNTTDTAHSTDSTSTYYTATGGGTTTTTEDSSDTMSTSTPTPTATRRIKNWSGNNNQQQQTGGWDPTNNLTTTNLGLVEADEQDLVQRWMRLEDMRNEEEAAVRDDQLQLWSWDWDGIIRSNSKEPKKIHQMMSSSDTLDLPNLHLSKDVEPWEATAATTNNKSLTSPSKSPLLDSNTFTKSKKKSFLESQSHHPSKIPSPSHSPRRPLSSLLTTDSSHETVPPLLTSELDFTAEFYRLTSSGTEDKIIQTETAACSSSTSMENIFYGEEAPADPLPLTSKESDLFLQCKNCLEKMSKLISLQKQQEDNRSGEVASGSIGLQDASRRMSITEQVAQLLRMNNNSYQHYKEGSASKWLPVSQSSFISSPQGDRNNYALLSSTESEGLLSPSME